MNPFAVPGQRRKRDPFRIAATALAILIACSLLATAVGTSVFDLTSEDPEPVQELAEPEPGEFERELREAIRDDPNDTAAIVSLANLRAQRGDLDEAIDLYEQALAVEPDAVATRFDFGRSLAEGGRLADAEVQYQRLLELDPRHAEGHYYLAELYRQWQPVRRDEALTHYREVVELAPDSFVADRAREEIDRLQGSSGTPETAEEGAP